MKLSAENASLPPDQNLKKISASNEGKEVAEKFIVRLSGVYLKPKNKLTEDERRLCNFSFEITAIRVLKNRDGTVQREVVYNVISSDLAHRADEFDEKNLPSLPEKDFDKIVDEIFHLFKETYICPENKNIARDYLREYGAIVYREFRRSHDIEEFFSYHGWELVGDNMCYLLDSHADCKCGIFIPKISPERMAIAWRNDLQILNIGKKVYNPDDTLDDIASLKVSLPFWYNL